MLQKIWSVTQTLRLPSVCSLCNQFHKNKMALCAPCIELIPLLGTCCKHCAYPLPDNNYLICGRCIKEKPKFDTTICNYIFAEPLRTLLHQFKYHNGLYLSTFLAQLILTSVQNTNKPQCLIPVPMHPQRIQQRGFNQAAILTKIVAKKLQLPYQLTSCQKMINTAPQASLDGKKRKQNLMHAFKVKNIDYQHVAIVDDLLTTGCTANELADTLKKTGVEQVDVWCCARTIVTY